MRFEPTVMTRKRSSFNRNVFRVSIVLVTICFVLVACSHWRDNYLDDGVDQVTQAEVREKLGKPHITKEPLLEEETIWIYRYALTDSEIDPLGVKSIGRGVTEIGNQAASIIGKGQNGGPPPERINCFRYVLKFDREKILRDWKREPC